MAPPREDRKVSLSFINWALGGSLVNVDQKITGKDGKQSRRVSSKLAIKVDAVSPLPSFSELLYLLPDGISIMLIRSRRRATKSTQTAP